MDHRLLLALLLCVAAHPLQASNWRQSWGMAHHPVSVDTPDTQLRLQPRGDRLVAVVEHHAQGPAQIRLDSALGRIAGLPLQRTLPGPGRYPLITLPTTITVTLTTVPGAPISRPATPQAVPLPFVPQPSVRIHQAGAGHTHRDDENRHAYDFALPEGTPILAVRTGVVMAVHGSTPAPTGRTGDGGNWVRILHDDGSMAIYAHLSPHSLRVRPGQRVTTGTVLANSGNTGQSRAPHLHLALQYNVGMRLVSLPFEVNGPQGRLQAARSSH